MDIVPTVFGAGTIVDTFANILATSAVDGTLAVPSDAPYDIMVADQLAVGGWRFYLQGIEMFPPQLNGGPGAGDTLTNHSAGTVIRDQTNGITVLRGDPATAGTNQMRVVTIPEPSVPYVIELAILSRATTNNRYAIWRNSGSNQLIRMSVGAATQSTKLNSPTSFNGHYFSYPTEIVPSLMHMRFERTASLRLMKVLEADGTSVTLHSVGHTDFFDPDEVGWGMNDQNISQEAGCALVSWKLNP